MITQKEINALNLSPTKKDFVQIWNELLEVAGKLSERWDPTSTNESDPGIVILKALTGIADKLNYNIDKNILEAYMPTAAQEDSMRKLCDMLGYNIKYYRSATVEVDIKYHNSDPSAEEEQAMKSGSLFLPKFTVITNSDKDISYFTINQNPIIFTSETPTRKVMCMEGQVVKCESANDNGVITANQISENNRFYLPEAYIAENGIFVYNATANALSEYKTLIDGIAWEKVDNLNIYARGSRVFKFGYDSYESRPYIEFPEDYSSLFNDGIFVYYVRTSGLGGNVSARTLTQIELPTEGDWGKVSADSFSVENTFAATSGADIETIKQAYNNFKKTIGTFETLVTCRDYMNKIYLMLDDFNKPIVSNVLVTDIRNDINKAITICSCDDAGIFYKESPVYLPAKTAPNKPVFNNNSWHLGSSTGMELIGSSTGMELSGSSFLKNANDLYFNSSDGGEVIAKNGVWAIKQGNYIFETKLPVVREPGLNSFDIVLYPYKAYNQIAKGSIGKDVRAIYDSSFTYANNMNYISTRLEQENTKTIAHNIISPSIGDILSINNYYRLNATIVTNSKITVDEGTIVRENVKVALANAFNMHELDFGEEIPFDAIVDVIENADSRIRVASLNEPAVYTTFSVYCGNENNNPIIKEYAVASDSLTYEQAKATGRFNVDKLDMDGKSISTFNTCEARDYYNKLAVRNILAGRVELFNYNNTFKPSFSERAYQITQAVDLPEDGIIKNALNTDDEAPFEICCDDNATYTRQGTVYKKTCAPDKLPNNNVITEIIAQEAGSDDIAIPITNITTSCTIKTNKIDKNTYSDSIKNVTLNSGEFVKFRAPNFTTIKTYPAYVNYHLALNTERLAEAVAAEAVSLFDCLNKDWNDWEKKLSAESAEDKKIGWQKVLDYFSGNANKKTFTLTQRVSAFSEAASTGEDVCQGSGNESGQHVDNGTGTCAYCGTKMISNELTGPIIVSVNNGGQEEVNTYADLLAQSGCVKITNDHDTTTGNIKARLEWEDPNKTSSIDLPIVLGFKNPFITDANLLEAIKSAVDTCIEELKGSTINGKPALPTEGSWTINFDFECMPFTPSTLVDWEAFVRSKSFADIAGFTPKEEHGTVLYRVYGEGYSLGKYVLQSTEKLLKFDSSYFGLLPSMRLTGIFVAEELGEDAKPSIILNNEEYMLRTDEYLYIEYTPSSTTDDGTTQEMEAVSEVYGPGTIIRPSGFEAGLIDSSEYTRSGNTPFKTVTFSTDNSTAVDIDMHRFGANEQVEIRDFAKVVLSKDSFKSSSGIYYYKNFNNCAELESGSGERTYTLKDGECIFYTDVSKMEYAWFTTGTEVIIDDNIQLEQFEVIDLATILDSGPQVIPWKYLQLSDNDKIEFQEFQYITLGANDTIENITLLNSTELSGDWQYCDNVKYCIAGSEATKKLPTINTFIDHIAAEKGCGWQACSTLELGVSYDNAQTLRTGQVSTSITLKGNSQLGGGASQLTVAPVEDYSLCFKTNLACHTGSSNINIEDVYSRPNDVDRFEFKIFAVEAPAIVETEPYRVVPHDPGITDILNWLGEPLKAKNRSELWTAVDLSRIQISDNNTYESALRLPVSLLPNTYGIFSIYIDCNSTDEVWIETVPNVQQNRYKYDVTLLHLSEAEAEQRWVKCKPFENKTYEFYKLHLNAGINCVRVNTTGRLFIKSSKGASGVLYFDDFKLVNCEQVELSDNIKLATNGLNIKRLGYLQKDNTVTALSEETVKVARDGYIKDASNKIATKANEYEDSYIKAVNKVIKQKEKIKKLVEIEDSIKKDIARLKEKYPDAENGDTNNHLKVLFNKYIELTNVIDNENSLKNALDANNFAELERLTEMFSNFSIEEEKQKLLDRLDALIDTIKSTTINFSNVEVLNDFNDNAFNVELGACSGTIAGMQSTSRELVDKHYNSQLALLATELNSIANNPDSNTILTLLNDLQHGDRLYELTTKVKQLIDTRASTLESELETLYRNSLDEDYLTLETGLVALRSTVSTQGVDLLISEIETAVAALNNERLANLVDELTSKLMSGDDVRVAQINNIITEVAARPTETEKKNDITNSVKQLWYDLSEDYSSKLTDTLSEIENIVLTSEEHSGTIDNLLTSKNEQIVTVTNKLLRLHTARAESIAAIDKCITSASMVGLPFYEQAVLAYWPEFMKQWLFVSVDAAHKSLRNAISNLETESSTINKIMTTFYSRPVVWHVTKFSAFQEIFDSLCALKEEHAQIDINNEVILTITNAGAQSDRVTSAIENFNINNKPIITSKLNAIKDSSITIADKAKLLKELSNELTVEISNDEELLRRLADILVPDMLLIDSALKDDDENFYIELINILEMAKTGIKTDLDSNLSVLANSLESLHSTLTDAHTFDKLLLEDGLDNNNIYLNDWVVRYLDCRGSLLPDQLVGPSGTINDLIDLATKRILADEIEALDWTAEDASLCAALAKYNSTVYADDLAKLKIQLEELGKIETVTMSPAFTRLELERQLLSDIRELDVNKDFYYTAPVETSLAIEFADKDDSLMNPITNFDINNINNNFVISKLDIGYLDSDGGGIQIARSSRLN